MFSTLRLIASSSRETPLAFGSPRHVSSRTSVRSRNSPSCLGHLIHIATVSPNADQMAGSIPMIRNIRINWAIAYSRHVRCSLPCVQDPFNVHVANAITSVLSFSRAGPPGGDTLGTSARRKDIDGLYRSLLSLCCQKKTWSSR
jgi:hypothetical protein